MSASHLKASVISNLSCLFRHSSLQPVLIQLQIRLLRHFQFQKALKRIKMGALDYVSDLFTIPTRSTRRLKKRKQFQTVEIKVRIDCEGCERKVKKAVEGMKGVTSVEVERKQHKLTVVGYVEPSKVLRRVRWRTGKNAEFWPYVPYSIVAHPYAPGAYDRKAPPGHVRNVMDPSNSLARATSTEERYTTAFSDDNPNACTIM